MSVIDEKYEAGAGDHEGQLNEDDDKREGRLRVGDDADGRRVEDRCERVIEYLSITVSVLAGDEVVDVRLVQRRVIRYLIRCCSLVKIQT